VKIDLVRQTPVPPPIDHAVITVSERELKIIATAVMRDTASGIRAGVRVPDVTNEEFEDLKRKFLAIFP
jgi:hypothetical protein